MKSLLELESRVDGCITKLAKNLQLRFVVPGQRVDLSDWARWDKRHTFSNKADTGADGTYTTQRQASYLERDSVLWMKDVTSMVSLMLFEALLGFSDLWQCSLIY